jgi:hypothetical protein
MQLLAWHHPTRLSSSSSSQLQLGLQECWEQAARQHQAVLLLLLLQLDQTAEVAARLCMRLPWNSLALNSSHTLVLVLLLLRPPSSSSSRCKQRWLDRLVRQKHKQQLQQDLAVQLAAAWVPALVSSSHRSRCNSSTQGNTLLLSK